MRATWETGHKLSLADWMMYTKSRMEAEGRAWKSCHFRTDDEGQFTYVEEWT